MSDPSSPALLEPAEPQDTPRPVPNPPQKPYENLANNAGRNRKARILGAGESLRQAAKQIRAYAKTPIADLPLELGGYPGNDPGTMYAVAAWLDARADLYLGPRP